MEVIVTSICLAIISILAGLAVFHPAYDDTLVQRIALAGTSLGTLACIPWAINNDLPSQVVWVSVCGALYAVSTARKAIQFYCYRK